MMVYPIPMSRFSWSGDAGFVRFVPLREIGWYSSQPKASRSVEQYETCVNLKESAHEVAGRTVSEVRVLVRSQPVVFVPKSRRCNLPQTHLR